MPATIYTNHTRFPAVATVHVTAVTDPKGALTVLRDGVLADTLDADKAYHDLSSPGGPSTSPRARRPRSFAIRTCP